MIRVQTTSPQQLVEQIKRAIADKRILTWAVDSEGDFSPTQDQWIGKAWMTPVIKKEEPQTLYFGIIESRKVNMTKSIYGVFHGRFAEMLLTHFDTEITSLYISPLLDPRTDIYDKNK